MGKSNWPEADLQLDVTVLATKDDGAGGLAPLSKEEREAVIHALIEKFNGAQDRAHGTVVIPLLSGMEHGPAVELWIHDWE